MFCNGVGCPRWLSCRHASEVTHHFAEINDSCGNTYIKEEECIDGGWYHRYEEEP